MPGRVARLPAIGIRAGMSAMLAAAYPWLKAAHIMAVISWMAGLLYLPRLFVYHCGVEEGSQAAETFKVMERRLMRGIMTPAMIASWLFGLAMIVADPGWFSQGWLHVKLLAVIVMSAGHMAMAGWRRDFAAGRNSHGERFYRIMNEVPAVLMVVIVIMVIVKPF